MDDRLKQRLIKIDEWIDRLKLLEELFLQMAAHEKVLFSKLYLSTEGNVEQRKALVYSSPEWSEFVKGFVHAEANYIEGKRRLELKLKSFDSEYLTYKVESQVIPRAGRN